MTVAWIEALRDRCGPLTTAALTFVDEQAGGAIARGTDGIRRLTTLVRSFAEAEEISEEHERRFVEGAGALLGVILVDHLGGGHRRSEQRHRVALGERGFFDPFAAISAALDADDPRGELARRVAAAEAEARGEGPVSRVVTSFERQLRSERPELVLVQQFELGLVLRYRDDVPAPHRAADGDIEVDLRRVAETTSEQGIEAVHRATGRVISMLPGGRAAAELTSAQAREMLLPRLVGESFVQQLQQSGTDPDALWLAPLPHGVRIALVLAYEDRSRYVREREVASWQLDRDEALAVAVRNLATRSREARFVRVETEEGPMLMARSGDGLDAARLLLPSLHDVLSAELEPPVVAAIPHRDTLLACTAADAPVLDALRARAHDDARRAPHRISTALFEVSPRGIAAWPPSD